MIELAELTTSQTRSVAASPDSLYAMVSNVTRMGQWSPVCSECVWDDDTTGPLIGSWFTGTNNSAGYGWETRAEVVAAEPGKQFAFVVGGAVDGWVRWSYTFAPRAEGTEVTESWQILRLMPRMGESDDQLRALKDRTITNIGLTLDNLKRAAEA